VLFSFSIDVDPIVKRGCYLSRLYGSDVHWKLPMTLHWNWKFQWKVLEVLEDHWKLPIATPTNKI